MEKIMDKLDITELGEYLKNNCSSFKRINKNGESVYIILKNGGNVSDLFELYASLRKYGIDSSLKIDTKNGIKKRFVIIKKKEGKQINPKKYNYRKRIINSLSPKNFYVKMVSQKAEDIYKEYHKNPMKKDEYSDRLSELAYEISKTGKTGKSHKEIMGDIQIEEDKIEKIAKNIEAKL